MFKKVDEAVSSVNGANVDFVLFSFQPKGGSSTLGEGEVLGDNGVNFDGTPEAPILTVPAKIGGFSTANAVPIRIEENVTTNAPQESRHGMQYLLNHEAGHFLYMVENTAEYIMFRLEQQRNHIDNDGGHHPDDKSGKRAIEYGRQKDIQP